MDFAAAPSPDVDVPFSLPTGDMSLWLWLLAAVVALLSAHVSLGWLRVAQRRPGLRRSWGALSVAAGTLGTGICAAVVLTLAGEPLDFWLGYRTSAALSLWVGAMLGCLPLVLVLSYSPTGPWLSVCGALLGLLAASVQAGWLLAVGFVPGIRWPLAAVLPALGLMMVGFGAALALALAPVDRYSGQRGLWRLGAAAVLGVSLFAGQEVLMLGVGLPLQKASAYVHDTPDSLLNMVCGALVPAVLAGMAGHLELRRLQQRRRVGDRGVAPPKRRKRRHSDHSL